MNKQSFFDIWASYKLSSTQIESVLCWVLSLKREDLFRLQNISVSHIYDIVKSFYELSCGKPQAYILQKQNFYGKDFFVNESVLVPRNDTEILVSEALKHIHSKQDIKNTVYIDIWTGSWCIPISIVSEMLPLAFSQVFVGDISAAACEVAQKNIDLYVAWKIQVFQGSLLEPWFHDTSLNQKNLCITANLPYIAEQKKSDIQKEVLKYEPHQALFGWPETGFELYKTLIKQCFQVQKIHSIPQIHLFIEIGYDQYDISKSVLQDFGLSFEYFQDTHTIARVIHISGF